MRFPKDHKAKTRAKILDAAATVFRRDGFAGAGVDAVYAFTTTGLPPFDPRPTYWLGTVYLALAGSVITFPLYFRLIQRIGADRPQLDCQ